MAGVAPPPKPEELQPHPVKDQLPNVSYCITSPPPWRKFTACWTPFVLFCKNLIFLFSFLMGGYW